jgi:membrane protein implicated in regulation of membrane protease activity
MDAVTTTFLVIGGLGVAVLAVSVLLGDLLNIGHPDVEGPFSVPAVAGFVGAFGFAGAIASYLIPAGVPGALAVAFGAGLVAALPTAWLAIRLTRAALNMRTDATPTQSDLVGTLGVVVTPIPAGGYGEVRVRLGGQQVKLNARSDQPLPLGARVFVIQATSPTSVFVEETKSIEEV